MSSKRQALRADVQEEIQNRLMQGDWRPGARLSIDGLARDLDVSPTPVREALAALERSELITYQPLKGFVVAPPLTAEQIGELIDARLVVELAAFTRAFGTWQALLDDLCGPTPSTRGSPNRSRASPNRTTRSSTRISRPTTPSTKPFSATRATTTWRRCAMC